MGNFRELLLIAALLFISSLYSQQSLAYTIYDAQQLYSDKLVNYTKQFRPLYNQTHRMNISVGFELIGLKEFDEINEKIAVSAVLQMSWTDESMTWTPASYGGMEDMVVDNEPFWKPSLTMTNSFDKLKTVGGDDFSLTFQYDGTVLWYPGDVMAAMCSIDITYYPFDTQKCIFEFLAWGESIDRIALQPFTTKVGMAYFSGSGAWELTDSSIYTQHDGVGVVMKLVLRRKPLYIVVNVLLPIILMSIVNLLVFLIPAESGERVSFGITVLLAMAVFLTIVGDSLPKISTPMALMSYYLTGIVSVSVFIVLFTIVNLRIFHKDPQLPVTPFYIRFVRLMNYISLSRCLTSKSPVVQVEPASNSVRHNRHQRNSSINGHMLNDGSLYNVKDVEKNAEFKRAKQRDKLLKDRQENQKGTRGKGSSDLGVLEQTVADSDITWQDVSGASDKLLLVVFSLCTFLLTLISFVRIGYNV